MKMTDREEDICDKYRTKDKNGHVQCYKCPLNLTAKYGDGPECYATIHGGTSEAKELKRYV